MKIISLQKNMVGILNKNSPSAIFLGLAAMAALWIPSFYAVPILQDAPAMPLEALLLQWAGEQPFAAAIAVPLLVLVFALLLVRMEFKYQIMAGRLYAASFLYVLLCSAFPVQRAMSGAYPAALLLIAALFQLFRLYKTPHVFACMFYAGMWLGLAALCYAPAALLVILLPLSLIQFRPNFQWREHLVALFGAALPFLYLCATYFLLDYDILAFFNTFYNSLFTLSPLIYENSFVTEKIYLAYVMFLMLQAFFLITKGLLTYKQSVKKIHVLLLWTFLLLLGVALFLPSGSMLLMPLLALPASILIANYFMATQNRGWATIQLLILIAFTFLVKFLGYSS